MALNTAGTSERAVAQKESPLSVSDAHCCLLRRKLQDPIVSTLLAFVNQQRIGTYLQGTFAPYDCLEMSCFAVMARLQTNLTVYVIFAIVICPSLKLQPVFLFRMLICIRCLR
jgi:hypothetical protein